MKVSQPFAIIYIYNNKQTNPIFFDFVSIPGTYQDDPEYMGEECKPCPEVCK